MNQPITSNRGPLTAEEIALINEIKAHAEQTRELVGRVTRFADDEMNKPLPEGHAPHSTVTHPMRWASIASTDLQQGYMALVRAVAAPGTF